MIGWIFGIALVLFVAGIFTGVKETVPKRFVRQYIWLIFWPLLFARLGRLPSDAYKASFAKTYQIKALAQCEDHD